MAAVEENVKPSREESVEASSSDDENSPFNSGEKEEPAKSFKDLVRRVQTNTGSDVRLCYEVCVCSVHRVLLRSSVRLVISWDGRVQQRSRWKLYL